MFDLPERVIHYGSLVLLGDIGPICPRDWRRRKHGAARRSPSMDLARNHADPTRYAAAIRGTNGFAEWVIDADFFLRDAPSSPGAKVEQGFWSVYDTMTLVGLDGAPIGVKAADGIASAVGGATVPSAGIALDPRSPPISASTSQSSWAQTRAPACSPLRAPATSPGRRPTQPR